MKQIKLHPKALAFIRDQSATIKQEIGEALRDVQKGISLGLPLRRPMPDVAPVVHELRVKDETAAYVVYQALGQKPGGRSFEVLRVRQIKKGLLR